MQRYRGGWAPSLHLDFQSVTWLQNPNKKIIREAAFAALQKVGPQMQAMASKEISGKFALSYGFVRQRISGRPLSTRGLAYGLTGKRGALPLTSIGGEQTFAPKPVQTGKKKAGMVRAYKTGGGVKVTVLRGRRRLIPSAFIAAMPNPRGREAAGHTGVFRRIGEFSTATKGRYTGHEREKIKEIKAKSIFQLLRVRRIKELIRQRYREKLPGLLKHELQWRTRRTGPASSSLAQYIPRLEI
jgi:hypothetical protein